MSDRELRTMFSMQALDLATLFKMGPGVKSRGTVGYIAEIAAPDVSTAGGKQALQPIRMVPSQKGFSVLTVGSANPATRMCELRTWEYLDRVHRERFGKAVPLDRSVYGAFLDEARLFFVQCGLAVTLLAAPATLGQDDGPAPVPAGGMGSGTRIVVAVLLVAVVALTVIVLLLMRKH